MLDKDQIAAASQTLHDHWRAGTKLATVSKLCYGRATAPKAYAIQGRIESYSSASLFGWKIAATSDAGQKHINVDGPMAGRILAETVIPDGGTASMAGNEMRVAEPEFAFRMRTDLPPRSAPYTRAQVLDAVDTLHPAIEIPDSRFADFVSAGAAQIIADNACAHLFVLGAARDVGLARARSRRGEAGHHVARSAIHRSWQERARRSPARADMARQRIAPARRDPESRTRSSPRAPAIRRCRFSRAIFSRRISARSAKCRLGSRSLSVVSEHGSRRAMTGSAKQSISPPQGRWIASACSLSYGGTSSRTLLATTRMGTEPEPSPMSENRRADAHMGGAELDRDREVGAHAHRQIFQPVARGDLRGQRKMRRRRIVDRRDAHQAGNLQPVLLAAGGNEGVGLAGRDAGLLRLLAGIELDEQFRPLFLRIDFLG